MAYHGNAGTDMIEQPVTIYVYRLPDGRTQMATNDTCDFDLAIDILEAGIEALKDGTPVLRN